MLCNSDRQQAKDNSNSSRTYLVTLMAINTDSRELGPVKASL